MDIQSIVNFFNDVPNLISVFTLIITACTLAYSYKFGKDSQKISIVAQKRSIRIEQLRKLTSRIISSSECITRGINPTELPKYQALLISDVNALSSLLQYVYEKDIELIDYAKDIMNILCSEDNNYSTEEMQCLIRTFWYKSDLYIGTEFERLKKEASGKMERSGGIQDSQTTFDGIYKSLERESMRMRSLHKCKYLFEEESNNNE